MLSGRFFRALVFISAVLGWRGAQAVGLPFAVPIDPAQSSLTFQLCISGNCDSDSSSATGSATLELDSVDFPAQIALYDFQVQLTNDLQFTLSWGFFGRLDASVTDGGMHYASPGTAIGPVPVAAGAFGFMDVPTVQEGVMIYHATGIPCALLQAAGHTCDDTQNLADNGAQPADLNGTVTSQNRVVTLTIPFDSTNPIDPQNPSLGTLRVYGTLLGQVFVPQPLGDVDGDGDVDLVDWSYFADCLAGPEVTTPPPDCTLYHFENSDLDNDADVDLADFAVLAELFG